VVRLPFRTAAVYLPVLLQLRAGRGSDSPVTSGAVLLQLIRDAFPGRAVRGVGDAAYHGEALLVTGTTWTNRLPANSSLFAWAPPRTGKRGRPRLTGTKLPKAVACTVPFGVVIQPMVTAWYSLHGYGPTDVTDRASEQPRYQTRTEPSFENMIFKPRTRSGGRRTRTERPSPSGNGTTGTWPRSEHRPATI
jgi:hypothetical protein